MAQNYKEIEAAALSWLEDKLDEGRIVFKKTELKITIFKYLKSQDYAVELHSNYFFVKKKDEFAQEAFKQYYWKILIQFLNIRFDSEDQNPAWYLTGSYPYEFLVDSIKIPSQQEQITISTKASSNTIINLYAEHHLVLSQDKDFENKIIIKHRLIDDDVYVLKPEYMILQSNSTQYQLYEENIVAYLKQKVLDADYVLDYFAKNRSPVLQARLIGALKQIGNQVLSLKLQTIFNDSNYKVAIENPFSRDYKLQKPGKPAFVTRFGLSMAKAIKALEGIDPPRRLNKEVDKKAIDQFVIEDTYHNLTIEGYDVTRELINEINNKGLIEDQSNLRNTAAIAGFKRVIDLIKQLAGTEYQFTQDLTEALWQELWSPSINAGLFKYQIDTYRNHMVSIKGSNSVPPGHEKIHHLLEEFYNHANDFDNGFRQAIFLHFFYVWIHPHSDGNGRISRFLMNLAFIKDKYKWLTIPSEDRKNYFAALEKSQLEDDISYFADYIRGLVSS
ncbi:MAG: Fic family protein [Cyanobacteria bacterium]|nr:Fic family protein [Cyanobacteriota bacterium]